MAKNIDLYVDQGADFSFSFVAKDFSGNVINLTSFTCAGHFSTSNTGVDTVTPFSTVAIVDAVHGGMTFTLANGTTETLTPDSRYVYDIWVVSNVGNITYVLQGTMFVSGKI
jgi:hypothetical protein